MTNPLKEQKKAFTEALGVELKRLREEKGLTQNTLAVLAKCSPGEIADYESGRHLPSAWRLEQLRKALGVKQIAV